MNKKYEKIIPLIYLILCLIIAFLRVPFWDEARAWLIAQNCNLFEFLDMMKLECHLFIWYLIIAPFAKLNLFYPYSIYILNAVFSFLAIYVLWKKSPFSTLEKFLITFSVPFLFLWGVVARCYSVGILFLFLALSFYKIRFRKPFLYLTLLCISMNTSVMAFIGGFYLSLIFLFENFRKKDFYKLFSIFLVTLLIVLLQVFFFEPDYLKQAPEMAFLRDFLAYIFNPIIIIPEFKIQSFLMTILRLSVLATLFSFVKYCIKKNKKVLFFIFSTYFSMVILFTFFYSGNFWHYFYFYLYFIVSVWILKSEGKIIKSLNVCFILILCCFMFKGSLFIDSKLTTINNSTSIYIAKEILNNKPFKGKKLFCLDPWSDIVPSSLPFLKNKVVIYDIFGDDRFSYRSMRNQLRFNLESFNPDDFYRFVDKDSILLTTTAFLNHELNNPIRKYDEKTGVVSFWGKKYIVSFIPYLSYEKIHLWSYVIKVNKR